MRAAALAPGDQMLEPKERLGVRDRMVFAGILLVGSGRVKRDALTPFR